MTADPSVAVGLMPDVEHHPAADSPGGAVSADHDQQPKQKTPGSSRRGKQYKCGNCHELGHNQKTCPRRANHGNEAPTIQPALGVDAAEIFAGNVAPALQAVGNGHTALVARVQPCKLDAALEAANKRVISADKQVATAATDQEFEEATAALDSAVRHLEKVAQCAQRCAMVAHTLSGGGWEHSEREAKRMRLDAGTHTPGQLTPTTLALNDATAGGAAEAVDNGDVEGESKEEQLD